jgi:hypothetical protein
MDEYLKNSSNKTKLSSSVKSRIFRFLGTICHHYPEALENSPDLVKSVLRIYVQTIQTELSKPKQGKDIDTILLCGAIQGVNEFLFSFPISQTEYYPILFNTLLNVVQPSESTVYDVLKSGLQFIADHSNILRDFLLPDKAYQVFFLCIKSAVSHKNRDVHKIAYLAQNSFLREMASILVQGSGSPAEVGCFSVF